MPVEVGVLRVSFYLIINYCYVVTDIQSKAAVVIDPAWELDTIEAHIHKTGSKLLAVLLTHHHPDHVHLSNTFAKKYAIPVYMSKAEIDYYKFRCKNLIPIEEFNKPLKIPNINVIPIFSPGHTFGGTSYLIEGNFFTGDTLFSEGCGICTSSGADPYVLYESLRNMKELLTPSTVIYPGHSYGVKPGKTFRYLLKNNIYLQFDDAEEFVKFRMRKKQKGLFKFK